MITVYVVDDEYKAIKRLLTLMESIPGFEVIGQGSSYEEAVRDIVKLKPDLVFLDVEIRDQSGFDVLQAVNRQKVFPKVVFVTGHIQYAIKAIRVNALDYLLKPIDMDELRAVLDRVKSTPITDLDQALQKVAGDVFMTPREKEIMGFLCQGMKSQEIADHMYLSIHTIDTYRRKLLKRFKVRNTQELMSRLLQSFISQD